MNYVFEFHPRSSLHVESEIMKCCNVLDIVEGRSGRECSTVNALLQAKQRSSVELLFIVCCMICRSSSNSVVFMQEGNCIKKEKKVFIKKEKEREFSKHYHSLSVSLQNVDVYVSINRHTSTSNYTNMKMIYKHIKTDINTQKRTI